jgi:hypothetical protein
MGSRLFIPTKHGIKKEAFFIYRFPLKSSPKPPILPVRLFFIQIVFCPNEQDLATPGAVGAAPSATGAL